MLKNLSEIEAIIYEQCLKLKLIDEGEVLLNVEGIPQGNLPEGWYSIDSSCANISKDPFYERYLEDFTIPYFDIVNQDDLMSAYFYPYHILFECKADKEVTADKIRKWIVEKGGKVYNSMSVKTRAVIVQGGMSYERYSTYRNKGKKIFSVEDVIKFIDEGEYLDDF